MAGHRQDISRISKSSQNILIYNFIITTFDCQDSSQGGGTSCQGICSAATGFGSFSLSVNALVKKEMFTCVHEKVYQRTTRQVYIHWNLHDADHLNRMLNNGYRMKPLQVFVGYTQSAHGGTCIFLSKVKHVR